MAVAIAPGKRTAENIETPVGEVRRPIVGRLMNLMANDDCPAYESAIQHAYGETITPPRTGKRGGPRARTRSRRRA